MKLTITKLLFALISGVAVCHAATLTDNLAKTTASTEFVAGNTWIAAAFATNDASYRISSATLLLSAPSASTAKLDLYSTGTGQPTQLLSTLASPASFPNVASNVSFTGSSYILSPNSTYWLVLKATSGSFDWSWTSDGTGTGIGFLSQWGASDDAGATWFTSNIEPMQLRVLADPVNPVVPEPQSLALAALGLLGLASAMRARNSACR